MIIKIIIIIIIIIIITVNLSQINLYIVDTFIADICYGGHFFGHRMNILSKIYLLIADNL